MFRIGICFFLRALITEFARFNIGLSIKRLKCKNNRLLESLRPGANELREEPKIITNLPAAPLAAGQGIGKLKEIKHECFREF